ncbi:calcium-activated potassium channel subunit beta-1-like [Branchiostoma floridae]|uniref:Calcium-activated potassium channel subunit beta-1-like n=1 Tax=Branchiostoma floridae TaxID=7739 RepID=A0A9J7MBL9_BRAFL|nr:calcium-activated potassium channel subunit beta-1-like [Branchiostoma floridae]
MHYYGGGGRCNRRRRTRETDPDRRAVMGRKHRYFGLLLASFILAGCCLGAMIACGVSIVQPMVETNSLEFQETTCTTTNANLTGEEVDCKCGKHCHSEYPCLRIDVSYADKDGTTNSGVLFETEKRLHKGGEKDEDSQCVVAPCDRSRRDNEDAVSRFQANYPVGRTFKCLYNPDNTQEVLIKRLYTWNDMFHSMFWSTLGFVIFSGLLVYFFFKCRRARSELATMPIVIPPPGATTAQPGEFLPPPYPGAQTPYPQALQPPPYHTIDSKDEKTGFTFN